MAGKSYSRPTRLAAVMLARQAGAETAGRVLGIKSETVAKWAQTLEIPSSEWGAVESLLLARGSEMSATGKTSGLVATLTAAGIAARNRRYEQLTARAEQSRELSMEREAEPEAAWHAALRALSGSRKRLLVAELGASVRAELAARADDPALAPPPAAADSADEAAFNARMLAFVEQVAAAPDEEIEARLLAIEGPLLPGYPQPQDGPHGESEPGMAPNASAGDIVAAGTPEAVRARLARDVSLGSPQPEPVQHPSGDLIEPSDSGVPWQWIPRGSWKL